MRAYAPHYSKVKDEGWWLLLGNATTGHLLTLKRVSVASHTSTRLVVPHEQAHMLSNEPLVLFCVSDSYMGLDVAVRVAPKGGATWPAPMALECVPTEAVLPRQEGEESVEEVVDLTASAAVEEEPVPDLAEVVASLPGEEDDDFWEPA